MSLELAERPGFSGCVTALDFALPMLVAGRLKLRGRAVVPVCGDSLRLPFPDESFDAAMVAFGIRNLADVGCGFRSSGASFVRGDGSLSSSSPLLRTAS